MSGLEPYRDPSCQQERVYPLMEAHSNTPRSFMWFFLSSQSSSTKIFVERKDVPTGFRTLNTRIAERLSNIASNQFSITLNGTVHTKHSLCKSLSESEADTCGIRTRDAQQGCEALYKTWLTGNQYYKQTHNQGSITATMYKPARCCSANTCQVCASSGKSFFNSLGIYSDTISLKLGNIVNKPIGS